MKTNLPLTSAQEICQNIHQAFSIHLSELFEVTSDNFEEIIKNAGRNGDKFTMSCLPGLLCLAILKNDEIRQHRIRSMIEFLDVDFFEEEPNSWIDLKQRNMSMFSLLNEKERNAVIKWLEFIKSLDLDNDFDSEEVESALRYWHSIA